MSSVICNGKYSYIPIIAGPTASGKSSLALSLALDIGGEIVSCDSMQIYKGLDIGTAKVTSHERELVKHHLIDIVNPSMSFSVSDFVSAANQSIDEIITNNKIPILCGGTGQYISALFEGIKYIDEPINESIVDQLNNQFNTEGIDGIYNELSIIDPIACSKIHKNNTRRVIRALAIYKSTNKTMTWWNSNSKIKGPEHPYKLLVLDVDRELLYSRINDRVDKMVAMGLVEEVHALYDNHVLDNSTARQAIGYKELFDYFDGLISLDKAIYDIKLRSRHYAKRQLTWFRYMKDVISINPNNTNEAINYITEKIK